MPGPRLHSCLHCIFFGCYAGHIQDHSKSKKHFLYVDLSHGNIYCAQCQDYIYDRELTEIANLNRIKETKFVAICTSHTRVARYRMLYLPCDLSDRWE